MGTEVLRPQDCLGDRFKICPPAFHRRRSYFPNGNGFGNTRANNNGYRRPLNRPERLDQKKKPNRETQQSSEIQFQIPSRSSSAAELRNHLNKPSYHHYNSEIETGRVTILRRGQSYDSFDSMTKKENHHHHHNNNRTRGGGILKMKLNVGCSYGDEVVYAGSAFSVSPSPSSLPLPSFCNSSNNNKGCEFDDSATRDLRRLLRLG